MNHQLSSAVTALLLTAGISMNAAAVVDPIKTRFAQTNSNITVELTAYRFSDVTLDEADQFDGWSSSFEITLPFNDSMQFRLSVPFYTDGDARLTNPGRPDTGQNIEINGHGGVFDFTTLQFEQQLMSSTHSNYNLAYYLGGGIRTDRLDTTTVGEDFYNHRGRVLQLGIKMDAPVFDDDTQWLLNSGIRYYFDTDDLHYQGKSDFTFADIKSALLFKPWLKNIQPMLELTYLGDFGNYHDISLIPEVVIPFSHSVSLKFGGILGLTNDGNQAGAIGSLAIGF